MKKTDEQDNQFLKGVDFDKCFNSDNPLKEAIDQIREQRNSMGVILAAAHELTGSDAEDFKVSVNSFENIIKPVVKAMTEIKKDPEALKEFYRRMASQKRPK